MSHSSSAASAAPTTLQLMELFAVASTAYFQEFTAAAAHHGLTPMQAKLLSQLRQPLPMRQLAERLVCDASNITGIVDRLEARGLVRREMNPDDRRIKNVVRTDAGTDVVRRVRAEMQATHQALEDLSAADRVLLTDLLQRLRASLDHRG
ncbi:MarR family winged helix-turn-helix transcriptional regulator [Couchioplanes caeruleus]|uniref:MarR family winged helix-turn-helix transcriptional regulator n=1 Tax=Couchioplanes caeruleus TaxID=56438 RepID=UPI001B8025B2|nr:MarR family transcriptional regulator [Couchioplanes caeruleus]